MTDQPETLPQFGIDDCTCIPFTRQDGPPRYCRPGDTVDMISGWEVRPDCLHHRGARTTPDNPAASGDAADNSRPQPDDGLLPAWWVDAVHAYPELESLPGEPLTGIVMDPADVVEMGDPELTAEEARELADQLGFELYQAQDAVAFVEECCVIADREGLPVTTALVREWLQGPKCARQMAAGVPALPDRAQAAIRELQRQVAVRDAAIGRVRDLLADPDNSWQIEPADLRAALDNEEAPDA